MGRRCAFLDGARFRQSRAGQLSHALKRIQPADVGEGLGKNGVKLANPGRHALQPVPVTVKPGFRINQQGIDLIPMRDPTLGRITKSLRQGMFTPGEIFSVSRSRYADKGLADKRAQAFAKIIGAAQLLPA